MNDLRLNFLNFFTLCLFLATGNACGVLLARLKGNALNKHVDFYNMKTGQVESGGAGNGRVKMRILPKSAQAQPAAAKAAN